MPAHDPSALRLDAAPFVPDGGAPFFGTAGLFLGAILAGFGSGWLVEHFLGQFCCCSGFIQVAVLSFVLGGVGSFVVQFGKIRSPFLAGFAGLVGVLASVVGKFYAQYERAPNVARAGGNRGAFIDFLQNVEPVMYAMVGLGLLIGAGGCIAIMARAASRPFCVKCQNWKSRYRVATLAISRERALAILETGTLTHLATVDQTLRKLDPGIVAHVCTGCGTECEIELELVDVTRTKAEKELMRSHGLWTYPGWAWVVIDRLFPRRLPAPDAHPDRFDPDAG